MIYSVRGKLTHKEPFLAVVECSGIGYACRTTHSTASQLGEIGKEVYIEPGEAVALNAGYLVASVLDIIENDINIAILDASAACHMPDVLEMPYRPNIIGSGQPDEKKYSYRLGGNTCLAGDIIGDYSFDTPLNINDKLVFCDMAIYTTVKNNTFNGINLPSIAVLRQNGKIETLCEFGYTHFAQRLGNEKLYHEL